MATIAGHNFHIEPFRKMNKKASFSDYKSDWSTND